MKLRWIEREEFKELRSHGLVQLVIEKVKVLQYWDKDYFGEDEGLWVDVPLEVEEV